LSKVIGIPSNGPELSDYLSEHFGHARYFVGIKLNDQSYEKVFSLPNEGHSSCMEPVLNMKNRDVTDMIIGGIGGRPFMGFNQVGINLYLGVQGKSVEENIKLLLEGRLKSLNGPSCSGTNGHSHSN
jgi:predicted Fe-Mo cluster-binding NifX family protein